MGGNRSRDETDKDTVSGEQRQPLKRQRTQDEHYRTQRAVKVHRKETRDSPASESTAHPGPRRPERCGVPEATRRSQLEVHGKLSPVDRGVDKEGHYSFELGDDLTTRYKILSKMGEGTFGRVLECWDRVRKDYVAVKIVRNIQKYREAAMIELEVLNTLEQNDPSGSKHCVSLLEWFDYRGHVCMVFEKLGPSLYDLIRRNGYKPFHVNLVREISRQLLVAVAYMHSLMLIHTDLKPENILFQSSEYEKRNPPPNARLGRRVPITSEIKVIDFGSATYEDQYHSTVVSTRHYRAPEVILGLGWTYPCDVWSIGCIIYELLTGDALFQTHENMEHLAMMERVLGPIPERMAESASRQAAKYFHRGRLNWPEAASGRSSKKAVRRMGDLSTMLGKLADRSIEPVLSDIVALLTQMLQYDLDERITALDALSHKFFTQKSNSVSPLPSAPAKPAGTN